MLLGLSCLLMLNERLCGCNHSFFKCQRTDFYKLFARTTATPRREIFAAAEADP